MLNMFMYQQHGVINPLILPKKLRNDKTHLIIIAVEGNEHLYKIWKDYHRNAINEISNTVFICFTNTQWLVYQNQAVSALIKT